MSEDNQPERLDWRPRLRDDGLVELKTGEVDFFDGETVGATFKDADNIYEFGFESAELEDGKPTGVIEGRLTITDREYGERELHRARSRRARFREAATVDWDLHPYPEKTMGTIKKVGAAVVTTAVVVGVYTLRRWRLKRSGE